MELVEGHMFKSQKIFLCLLVHSFISFFVLLGHKLSPKKHTKKHLYIFIYLCFLTLLEVKFLYWTLKGSIRRFKYKSFFRDSCYGVILSIQL